MEDSRVPTTMSHSTRCLCLGNQITPCSIPNPLSSWYNSICFNFHLCHSLVLADSISGDCTVVLETQSTIMCPNLELDLPLPSRNSQKR